MMLHARGLSDHSTAFCYQTTIAGRRVEDGLGGILVEAISLQPASSDTSWAPCIDVSHLLFVAVATKW